MNTLIAYLKILRPLNICIILFCIIISSFIMQNQDISLLPFITVILLIAGFANVINDIFDYKIDQINKPKSILVSKKISIKSAFIYALFLLCLSIVLIFIYDFNTLTKQIIFFNIFLIILYTPVLKKIPFIGNCIIALILSMVFIVTTAYLKGSFTIILPISTLSFLLMLIREIIKDIEDLEGDSKFRINTLPVRFGINFSFNVIIFLSLLLAFFIIILYYNELISLFEIISIYFFIIGPLFYNLFYFSKNKNSIYCIYLSKVLKLLTIFGVIVIYLTNL